MRLSASSDAAPVALWLYFSSRLSDHRRLQTDQGAAAMKLKLVFSLLALVGASIGARVLLHEAPPVAPQAQPSEARPSEARPSEAQPSEAQPSEARPSEARPSLGALRPAVARQGQDKAARLREAVMVDGAKLARPVADTPGGGAVAKVEAPPSEISPPKSAPEAAERLKAVASSQPTPKDLPTPDAPWPTDTQGIVRRALPYITEGGIAGLFGVALGVTTKSFARLLLGAIALCFIVIQFLAYKEILTVDWGKFLVWAQSFVFNLSDKDLGMGAILQHKLPAAGALGAGYLLGLKKG
ncbi:hypothetical protein KJ940_04530 [Myxococcota bacterium]|nr:hypothetical protein [Myxococcota bacterium]